MGLCGSGGPVGLFEKKGNLRKRKKHTKKYPHKESRVPQSSPKFFMWVAPSPLFSRSRGSHIKNFRGAVRKGGCSVRFFMFTVRTELITIKLMTD